MRTFSTIVYFFGLSLKIWEGVFILGLFILIQVSFTGNLQSVKDIFSC